MFAQRQPSNGWHLAPTGTLTPPSGQLNPVLLSPNAGDVHNDDTLERIYSAANEDVEMKDAFIATTKTYLVLDTNVLIDYLDVIKRFNEDIERLERSITIIIPSVLLSELDGLKKRDRVGWFASRASAWILNKMKERKTVHVQARGETCGIKLAPHELARRNDMYIYDCCQFFARQPDQFGNYGRVIFISGDMNLQNTVESLNTDSVGRADHVPEIVTVLPDRKGWSSRALANKLARCGVDIPGVRVVDTDPKYQRARNTDEGRLIVIDQGDEDDNMMDVDDSGCGTETNDNGKMHALDALRLQVVDHFTLLLKDLAQRVRTSAGDVAPPSGSLHAPGYRRTDFPAWTVADCLEYLGSKKPLRPCQPRLESFLRLKTSEGGRTGKEWTRRSWDNVADALEELGAKFADGAVLASVQHLRQETEYAFKLQIYPSGQ